MLVARDCTRPQGVDFFDTFSQVTGFDTMRTVLTVSSSQGWKVKTLDFKQTHLSAQLAEDIWLELPGEEVVNPCKTLHGYGQSAMGWWKGLRRNVRDAEWKSSAYDGCFCYLCRSNGKFVIMTTYVDDILLIKEVRDTGSGLARQAHPSQRPCQGREYHFGSIDLHGGDRDRGDVFRANREDGKELQDVSRFPSCKDSGEAYAFGWDNETGYFKQSSRA